MRGSDRVPSVEQRIDALRALFPLLPLHDPQPLFTEAGRGKRVIPWIQYYVGEVNIDYTDRFAARLKTSPEIVHAQLDAFFAYLHPSLRRMGAGYAPEGEPRLLHTRKALQGLPSLERVFEFEQYAEHADKDGPPTAIWWTLRLPVLSPAVDTALLGAQLGGQYGAEDHWWLARKARGVWTLAALEEPL
jgi:hypothetical protein